jgi:hypothetical protein
VNKEDDMTYPPTSGAPDPYQPQQPYGQQFDPTSQNAYPQPDPYASQQDPYVPPDPYAAPASGAPSSGQPYPPQYGAQPGPQPYGAQPPPYGAPQFGAQPYGPGYPATRGTNGLAIASLVCSLAGLVTCISAPVGIVLGHLAKKQIAQTGEEGDGMATAGLVVGYILTGLTVLACVGWIFVAVFANVTDMSTSP